MLGMGSVVTNLTMTTPNVCYKVSVGRATHPELVSSESNLERQRGCEQAGMGLGQSGVDLCLKVAKLASAGRQGGQAQNRAQGWDMKLGRKGGSAQNGNR
jgi:hypothetical protein